MAGPQDRDREPPREKKFDAVWGELLGDEPAEAPSAGSDRTKAWDDSARAHVVPGPDAETDEGEQPAAGTRWGHAGQLAKEAQEAAAAREMQRLMEGAAEQARAASALRLVTRDDEAAQDEAEESAKDGEGAEESARAEESEGAEKSARVEESARVEKNARVEERARVEKNARVREPMAAVPREGGGNKMLVGLVALAIAVGVGWMIVREPAPSRTPSALAKPPPGAPIQPKVDTKPSAPSSDAASRPIPAAGADDAREPRPDEGGSTGTPEALEVGESGDARPPTPTPTTAVDPREPPPGTPEEIAASFRKLPVSAADRAPVGGVGAGGIHVDRIWMGAQYEDGDCTGATDRFSVSADPRPSVCVRVVHPREKEEVAVVWQKDGGSARRGKLTIKPTHAYRTRAYLVLRREDVGDWTVRILSQDGVELASHAFQVVE